MERLRRHPASVFWGGSAVVIPLVLAAVLALFGAAPGLARQETPTVAGVPDPTVRVVHAAPDAPAVNILVDGQPVAEGVSFGSATDFAALPAGDHQVQVVPADGGEPIIDQTVTLEGWASYILAAVGQQGTLQLQVNQVDVNETSAGQARLRVAHAVPDAPAVSVGVTGSEEPLVGGVEFGALSDYQDVNAGTYDLEVRNADSQETLLAAPGVQLEAGQVYDVFAIGQASTGNVQLLPLATPVSLACGQTLGIGEATDSCLRIVHAAPDAGPVDVYMGENAVAEGIEYGTATDFAAAPNGQQQVRVVPAGGTLEEAVIDTTGDFTSGRAFQMVINGLAGDVQATIAGVDLRALPENQTRVRVVHAAPDLDEVNVAVAGGPTPFENLTFRSQSGYVVFDAGTYSFQLREMGANTLLLEALDVPIESGMVYDILAIGQSEAGTLQMVVLSATADVLAGPSATPIAGTPPAAAGATPAAEASPVTAVGSTPAVETPGAATPAATPTS